MLDNMDICPSLKGFDLGDPAGSLDIPFLKALEDKADELASNAPSHSDGGDAFGGGNDMAFGFDDGFGVGEEGDMTLGFGEGGEVWANETIADAAERFMSPAKRPMMGMGGSGEEKFGEGNGTDYAVGFGGGHEDILSYFDEALRKNWAGPEHWRIRKIRDNTKPTNAPVRVRKEKETFEIDFLDPAGEIPADVLRPPRGRATLDMPKKDWKTKSRHLLPDDKHFNSRQLLKLFLKPKASIRRTEQRNRRLTINRPPTAAAQDEDGEMDEEFWAKEGMAMDIQASSTPDPKVAGNYDANFFQDDGLDMGIGMHEDDDDEDEFADAREAFSPGPDGNVGPLPGTLDVGTQFPPRTFGGGLEFGSQLVTSSRRVRPEYVQYARVAKKVDVRKLKENLWSGLAFEGEMGKKEEANSGMEVENAGGTRKFTQIMNELQNVYPQKTMADISTSYCFICLLHLANEKGLVIEGSEGLTELKVAVDKTAEGPDEF